MPDEVIKDRLQLILEHASVIAERMQSISDDEGFLESKAGVIMIDSLITRLQALSENIKKIHKIEPLFFQDTVPIDVHSIIYFRDLASHHYEMLDLAMIVQICQSNVPPVAQAIQRYLEKLT